MKNFKRLTLLFLTLLAFACNDDDDDNGNSDITTYTVSYETNGGSAIDAVDVEENDKVARPTDPTKTDYTFVGWYTDNDTFQNAFDFDNDVITEDITLYARWSKNSVTVSFNSNGGSAVVDVNVVIGEKAMKPVDPTKEGYTFEGWYIEENLENVFDFDNQIITKSITLYAKWLKNTATVSFNSNGGSVVTDLIVVIGEKVTKPTEPTKEGHLFDGWYMEETLENVFDFDTQIISNNITLYAKWVAYLVPETKAELIALIEADTQLDLINTSKITDMQYLFLNKTDEFNGSIANWDVSNVTTMHSMFSRATNFNQDISNWDVSNVTDISFMFLGAESFNQDISGWNVSNVVTMRATFQVATSFNQDISSWDVSKVTNMQGMFRGATAFNQDLATWQMSSVTNMTTMFDGATNFNGDISSWDVSNVTSMWMMFRNVAGFNQDIGGWNVSKVRSFSNMFEGVTSFNQNIGNWDVSGASNFSNMFDGATSFNQDLSAWNVNRGSFFEEMFLNASSFNQPGILNWDFKRNNVHLTSILKGTAMSTSSRFVKKSDVDPFL